MEMTRLIYLPALFIRILSEFIFLINFFDFVLSYNFYKVLKYNAKMQSS